MAPLKVQVKQLVIANLKVGENPTTSKMVIIDTSELEWKELPYSQGATCLLAKGLKLSYSRDIMDSNIIHCYVFGHQVANVSSVEEAREVCKQIAIVTIDSAKTKLDLLE